MKPSTPCGSLSGDQATSAAYYKKMYDRVSALGRIGVWECELPSEQLTWTDLVYDLFEIPRGTPIDRQTILEMYEPECRSHLARVRCEALRDGIGFTLDAKIRTAKGNSRWIRITADVELEDGTPVRIFGTKQDITRERTTQEELHSLQTELIHVSRVNAMSTMASTLAHELNQPLTAIVAYMVAAGRLSARYPISKDFVHCIEGAGSAAQRAGEIIRRLREMTVKGYAHHERFDVRSAVGEAIALARAGRPDLEIICDADPHIAINADRIQIQQVLLNLIQNGYEAAGGSACRIAIAIAPRSDAVEICVSDDGPGINPDVLPHIFESLVTTKTQGMGIGLSVSRTIVEMHGGRITARNNPDRGAAICLTLPYGNAVEA